MLTTVRWCTLQLMGIDVDAKYNGTGSTFFTTMLVIEELSKVDPSVGAMVEVHNSLAVMTIAKYASEAQKQEWLPRLATDMVSRRRQLSSPSSLEERDKR